MFEPLSSPSLWCGAAIILWLVVFVTGVCLPRYAGPVMPALTIAASIALLLAALTSQDVTSVLPLPWFLGTASFSFAVDPLSRWFLAVIGLTGIPIALFSPGYYRHLRGHVSLGYVWATMALLMASMAGVVLASNAVVFLVSWEIMALSSFALVATDHENKEIQRAAFIYLGATRTGTAFLMAGFLWAHYLTGSWTFTDWNLSHASALAPALLILAGLATKAGCWPFHLWLPIAHPAAPAPVSAIMSGVMIKTAIYAMVRLFIVGNHINVPALGPLLLVLGAISAFWGVIFALLQHDLKRLLAYHSVENIGIILMGLGLSLIGVNTGVPLLAQLGLAAALFHTLNHAVFKSLLFLGTGAVDAQTHTRNVEQLGGLIHRMPWTAGAFISGSAAICALPPLNGFASEWLLYQGFFTFANGAMSIGARLAGVLLMAWLALVGALAIVCFVKVVGIVFLGAPRSTRSEEAREVSVQMRAAQVFLAALCAVLGLAAGRVLMHLQAIVAPNAGAAWSSVAWPLPTALLTLILALTVAAIAVLMWMQARKYPTRRFITWECGFGALGPRTQYTATSFAQPVSRIFGSLYGYVTEFSVVGRQRRHFPQGVEASAHHEAYLETRVYRPLLKSISRLSGAVLMRLQAGSVHQYLFQMTLVLALLLWLVIHR